VILLKKFFPFRGQIRFNVGGHMSVVWLSAFTVAVSAAVNAERVGEPDCRAYENALTAAAFAAPIVT